MEGGDHRIEAFGDLADGRGRDRAAQDRQQRLAHFAGRKAEHEAGKDHPVDMLGPPGVGAHHRDRAVGPGAWHRQFDVAKLRQDAPPVRAIAPVRLGPLGHTEQMRIDRLVHPALDDLDKRLPGKGTIILSPSQAVCLHGLHHLERCW